LDELLFGEEAIWHAPLMFPVASGGLFPRSSKRIITAGLRPTSNATYYHHNHHRTTFWIY
jgi:guanyl-specific ribonuclease Sa